MKLAIITPEKTIDNEIALVNELFSMGMQCLHLRKPLYNTDDYEEYINAIAPRYHQYIVIHNSFDLFNEYGLNGIHLNTAFRNDSHVLDTIKDIPASCISTSFHSWQEIEDNDFPYRYVFISPVFNSISKSGYDAGIDLTGAAILKQKLSQATKYCPQIVGLGGVGAKEITVLKQHRFDGAAVLGALWLAENKITAFKQIVAAING